MLQLSHITKDYKVGDTVVHALRGVDISFRQSEFVSILGPSGCGKTTLLNIIGGLDHYTSGEMKIDGVSTTDYGDRDWDTYRNHRIGFVFQSYNLIPHQTVSENVELALTISGVDKAERVRRAHEALDKVGLKDQYNKKPNQLSGGQCQRVAIARALVNDPEILLADEPTGALDTVTSVQIMDIIREVSKNCLVIMVTHNPELAEKYSTRIIRLLDGEVVSDSDPYDGAPEPDRVAAAENADERAAQEGSGDNGEQAEQNADGGQKIKKSKKSKLSFWSAFMLSARNLMSKFKRTLLVCFAGSIGIIGVATVLAVSTGVQNYIDDMQNDMLSGNPVSISTEALDVQALMSGMSDADAADAIKDSVEDGKINVEKLILILAERGESATASIIQNNITNEYLDYVKAMPESYYKAITASYGINASNNLYTDFDLEGYGKTPLSLTAALSVYMDLLGQTDFAAYSSYIPMFTESFAQAPDDPDFILSQYDIVSDKAKSKIATEADEIMIVISDNYSLTDLTLAQYGYFSQQEFLNIAYKAVDDEHYDEALWKDKFTYDELMNKTFTWYPNDTVFTKDQVLDLAPDENGQLTLVRKEGFRYTGTADVNWDTGKKLKVTAVLRRKDSLSYGCMDAGFYYTSAFAKQAIEDGGKSEIVKFLNDNSKSGFQSYDMNGVKIGVTFPFRYILNGEAHYGTGVVGSQNMFSSMMNMMAGSVPGGVSGFTNGTQMYELSMRDLGGVNTPNRISVYPTDFEWKDNVCAYLDKWNAEGEITVGDTVLTERDEIKYTDNLALVIAMVGTLIDIITTALVAFTSLSLVVSTVMVAIITYVSVIERIKEIGVIRSLGGRKRDVSALFNAETFIIGGVSGVIGVAVTYIISAIINAVLGANFGVTSIAMLTIPTALIMIAISIALTLISGLIPASIAAKKDPVDALRTE